MFPYINCNVELLDNVKKFIPLSIPKALFTTLTKPLSVMLNWPYRLLGTEHPIIAWYAGTLYPLGLPVISEYIKTLNDIGLLFLNPTLIGNFTLEFQAESRWKPATSLNWLMKQRHMAAISIKIKHIKKTLFRRLSSFQQSFTENAESE